MVVVLVITLGGDRTVPRARPEPAPAPSRMLSSYEYQFALPRGWLQTGGDPNRLRTELKPRGRESGMDRLLVDEIRLSFDSTTDHDRAVRKLRQDYENARDTYSDFDEQASYAGRQVIHYRERISGAAVDWYVLFQGRTQVSVGCQYADGGDTDEVSAACKTVVATLTVAG